MQALRETSLLKTQNPDWYLHMAIQAVRTSLAEYTENRETFTHLATGIHFLICSSDLGGHFEESRMHIHAFLKLLPYLDTQSSIGSWELDTVSSLDITMASASGAAPIMKIATSDPGPLTPTRAAQFRTKLRALQQEEDLTATNSVMQLNRSLSRHHVQTSDRKYDLLQNPIEDFDLNLGSSLQVLLKTSILVAPMSAVLRQMLDSLMVAKVVWRAPEFVTKQDTKWLCQRSRTCLYELLSLAGPKALDISTKEGRMSEGLRITLIMIMISVKYRSAISLARGKYGGPLKNVLTPLLRSDWNEIPWVCREPISWGEDRGSEESKEEGAALNMNEVLLWMLLTAHWATIDTPDECWFANEARAVALRKLSLAGNQLEAVMKRFLYSKTVQHHSLAKVVALMPF